MRGLAVIGLATFLAGCSEYQIEPEPLETDIPDPEETDIPVDSTPNTEEPIARCSVTPDEVQPPFESARFIDDGSYDPDGEDITRWVWTLVSKPSGSTVTLQGTTDEPNRTFTPDLAGEYVARLVVSTDDGRTSAPCEASLTATPSQDLWVEMYWEHSGDDMDLHLLRANGAVTTTQDCYYGNCTYDPPNWGDQGSSADDPTLDLDDVPYVGPENINIADPELTSYKVVVHDYPGSVYNGTNNVTVNIYLGGSLTWSDTRNINSEGTYFYYAEIDWGSQTVDDCANTGC